MIPKTFEQTNTKHTESAGEHNCYSQIHGKTERKKRIFYLLTVIYLYGSLWKRYYIPALTHDSNKEGAVTFVNPSHFVLRSIKSKQRKRKYMLRVFFDTKCWGPKAADLSCVTKSVCFPQVDVNISLALAFSANNKVNLLFPIMGTNFDLCASNLCRD